MLKTVLFKCIPGTLLAQKSYESAQIKTSEMTRKNVPAETEQIKTTSIVLKFIIKICSYVST